MIKKLTSFDDYARWIYEMNQNADYRHPTLPYNQAEVIKKLNRSLNVKRDPYFGVFDETNTIVGLFGFLILEEEHYGEMIVGLSRSAYAYREMLSYLSNNYQGYQFDFVFNPRNELILAFLEAYGAEIEIEQMKMVHTHEVSIPKRHEIISFDEKYRQSYLRIHQDENHYWTGEKVLEEPDRFHIILCIADGQAVGYIDVTHCFEENEPYDIYVLPSYRGQGIASEMLSEALAQNQGKKMMLLVDVTNEAAIHVYQKLGFEKADGSNQTAHLQL